MFEWLSNIFPNMGFDPYLPLSLILSGIALIAVIGLYGMYQGLRSWSLRSLGALALGAALLNPQNIIEEKEPLSDVALVLIDGSESMQFKERAKLLEAKKAELSKALGNMDNLEVITAPIRPDASGTRLTATLIEQLGDLPRSRLAGVIALSDGQVHDLPDDVSDILPEGVPFHSLIIGDPNARDRRIRAIKAAKFGLVDEPSDFSVIVDDPGHEGEVAQVIIRINGERKGRFDVTVGEEVELPIKIERRGRNTVELEVAAAPNELTLSNNRFISEISGIRDRLRVLLVTGQPHRGGRAWRNLLKSDPGVDLVQFTILTNPGVKNANARSRELSLIAFPTDQLFVEKLYEFDLVIFDKFRRRFRPSRSGRSAPILPARYLANVAKYLEDGGALLVATGDAFASKESLYRSPLAAVLPVRPTDKVIDDRFIPEVTEEGKRHPITAALALKQSSWGPWYRLIQSEVVSGDVLMNGAGNEPLLVIDRVKKGRVATLLSDQAWLWSKDHEGGGPYNELFRRVAHWLMGEPELEAERLDAMVDGDQMKIERFSIRDNVPPVIVTAPDGSKTTVKLEPVGNGRFQAVMKSQGQGAYRLEDGKVSAITAIGSLNPTEFAQLHPNMSILKPLADETGGQIFVQTPNSALPKISQVTKLKANENLQLIKRGQYEIRESRRSPYLPPIAYLLVFLLCMCAAWYREGH